MDDAVQDLSVKAGPDRVPLGERMHRSRESFMRNSDRFGPLFPPDVLGRGMVPIDLSKDNPLFGPQVYGSIDRFTSYIADFLRSHRAALAYGGYSERRDMYSSRKVFDPLTPDGDPRRIHMGLDFWGEEGTPVLAPLEGVVHSRAMNDEHGDYGATVVLRHEVEGAVFHTLYGHLCAKDLEREDGSRIEKGECFARFGGPEENGNWPPHLHLQVVLDMEGRKGDYPGVCCESELDFFLGNCPDPSRMFAN
jgi:hypothetical protein